MEPCLIILELEEVVMGLLPLLLQVVTVGQWNVCGGFDHFAGGRKGRVNGRSKNEMNPVTKQKGLDQSHIVEKVAIIIVAFKVFRSKRCSLNYDLVQGLMLIFNL